jgi:hypothetical protein
MRRAYTGEVEAQMIRAGQVFKSAENEVVVQLTAESWCGLVGVHVR